MAKKQENTAKKDYTKTSATIKISDFRIFKEITQEKLEQGEFEKNPLNSAWQEAIELFNEKNEHFLDLKIKRLQEMRTKDKKRMIIVFY